MVIVRHRLYGAYACLTALVGTTIFMLMQPNWTELWIGIVFTSAFSLAFAIYIKSNYTEKQRLQVIKDKKKEEKANRGKHKKHD